MTVEELALEIQGGIEYELGKLILFYHEELKNEMSLVEIFKGIKDGCKAVIDGYYESLMESEDDLPYEED